MKDEKSRIVIIGAGSTGSSVAYYLAGRTNSEIILIDKKGIGAGMTGFSTAIVRTHYSNKIVAQMALESRDILSKFQNVGDSGFVREGIITITDSELAQRCLENTEMLSGLGINEKLYKPQEATQIFPNINFDDATVVSYEPDSGYADPVTTANSFAKKAMELGTSFIRDNVIKIIKKGNRATSIATESGKLINMDKLILCTNVWTNHLLEQSGIGKNDLLPIKVSPHPVIMYRRSEALFGKQPIVNDLINRDYYKPEGDVLLSGGNLREEMDEITVDPDNFNENVPMDYIAEYSERIVSRLPLMRDAKLQGAYYGMYDNTPDEHPIVDRLESIGLSNVFSVVGLSGHGFKLAPSLGKMTADMVTEQYNEYLNYFKLTRFRDKTSIFKKYKGLGTVA